MSLPNPATGRAAAAAPVRSRRIRRTALLVAAVALLAACSDGGGDAAGPGGAGGPGGPGGVACEVPAGLTRSGEVPVGVLLPSGSFERQSYASAQAIADAGLNAVSLGWPFYYTAAGDVVFDFDGSADEQARARWVERVRCSVVAAKEAGLVVAVWGQFQAAQVEGEPGGMPEGIRDRVLEQALALVPEMARVLEELQVEYWSPVAELDKFAGIEGHNDFFARMVAAGAPHFSGTVYVQPNILQQDSFFVQGVVPDLGGVDALGVAWISYECEPEQLRAADFFLEAARAQGIDRVLITELGGTRAVDESARPCLEQLIARWEGGTNGVFLLDFPDIRAGASTIAGSWQEDVLRELRAG